MQGYVKLKQIPVELLAAVNINNFKFFAE